MRQQRVWMAAHGAAVVAACAAMATADPWADFVVEYNAGNNANPNFIDPSAALGEPTRVTAPASPFGGPTTPLNASFGVGETVTIGAGGWLTVGFDEAVTDDARNPFGIDLLIFGNAFYFDLDFPSGIAGPLFSEGGVIELSADGITFITVTGLDADGAFPTLGFNADGSPTDFTLPVDPAFNPGGLALADIIAGYGGSGGGVGIDIGAYGLSSVSFVRVSNPSGATLTPEIDGFADVVPAPGVLVAFAGAGVLAARRRRIG